MSENIKLFNNPNVYYVLYAVSNDKKYYVSNTNPILWTNVFLEAKTYIASRNAEYEIIRDYYNYNAIKKFISNQDIESIFLAEIKDGIETRRIQLL